MFDRRQLNTPSSPFTETHMVMHGAYPFFGMATKFKRHKSCNAYQGVCIRGDYTLGKRDSKEAVLLNSFCSGSALFLLQN